MCSDYNPCSTTQGMVVTRCGASEAYCSTAALLLAQAAEGTHEHVQLIEVIRYTPDPLHQMP
jgi:hypothetical protein